MPVISAAGSLTAARRAAATGVGLMFDSLTTPARCRELVDTYRDAGGTGPCVLIRRAWVGAAPARETERQVDTYRTYAPGGASSHWGADEMVAATEAEEVATRLIDAVRAAGADAVNVRVHVPGISPSAVRSQIKLLGGLVAPAVAAAIRR